MVTQLYYKYCWKKVSVGAPANKCYTPLIIASQEGPSTTVGTLIKNGVDPFKTRGHGATAIVYAVQHGPINLSK